MSDDFDDRPTHNVSSRRELFECAACHCRLTVVDATWEEPTFWLADGTGALPRFCPGCGRPINWNTKD